MNKGPPPYLSRGGGPSILLSLVSFAKQMRARSPPGTGGQEGEAKISPLVRDKHFAKQNYPLGRQD